jgi:hypothetical protein
VDVYSRTKKSPGKVHGSVDHAIETEMSTVVKFPSRLVGKHIQVSGFPIHVEKRGNTITFELVEPGPASSSPLTISLNSDKVSINTFKVAEELLYYKGQIRATGTISKEGKTFYLAATALDELD